MTSLTSRSTLIGAALRYARNIIESIYDYALRREQQVVPSSFSPQGQRLKHIFEEMNLRHPQAASNQPFRDLGK